MPLQEGRYEAPAPPQFYSVDQVAKMTGVCRATVQNRIRSGQLKSMKWYGAG